MARLLFARHIYCPQRKTNTGSQLTRLRFFYALAPSGFRVTVELKGGEPYAHAFNSSSSVLLLKDWPYDWQPKLSMRACHSGVFNFLGEAALQHVEASRLRLLRRQAKLPAARLTCPSCSNYFSNQIPACRRRLGFFDDLGTRLALRPAKCSRPRGIPGKKLRSASYRPVGLKHFANQIRGSIHVGLAQPTTWAARLTSAPN